MHPRKQRNYVFAQNSRYQRQHKQKKLLQKLPTDDNKYIVCFEVPTPATSRPEQQNIKTVWLFVYLLRFVYAQYAVESVYIVIITFNVRMRLLNQFSDV